MKIISARRLVLKEPLYLLIFYLIASLVFLSINLHYPVSLFTNASLDDGLYIYLGQNILDGQWLGPYNNNTLAKGSSFPIFLAINSIIGVPITFSISLMYLIVCYFFSKKLIEIGVNKYWAFLIFLLILFHPYLSIVNISRDTIYPALILIIMIGIIDLIISKELQRLKMFSYGVIIGIYWCTREDGAWIIPITALLLLIHVTKIYKNILLRKIFFKSITYVLTGLTVYLGIICSINFIKYKSFTTVDIKSDAFIKVLNSLYDIDVGNEIPFLPIPKAKRDLAYSVSPKFAELKDYLNGAGLGWAEHGCKYYPQTCGDYSTGWMIWALRSAVASRGYYSSPAVAEEYYKAVINELEDACRRGSIKCKKNRIGILPPITESQVKSLANIFLQKIDFSLMREKINYLYAQSDEKNFYKVKDFLGNPRTSLTDRDLIYNNSTQIDGWFYKKNNSEIWIIAECKNIEGNIYHLPIQRFSSIDVSSHFNDPSAQKNRFNLTLNMEQRQNCDLIIDEERLIFSEILKNRFPKQFQIKDNLLYIQSAEYVNALENIINIIKIRINIIKLYENVIPIIFIIGVLAFLFSIYKKNHFNIKIIILLCYGLYLSRISLLSIVEATSFPVRSETYMSIGFILPIIASLLSMYLFYITRIYNDK